MEGEMKEIIHEKEYVHDNRGWCDDGYYYGRRRGVDNSARALGIVGTVAGGLALLGGMATDVYGVVTMEHLKTSISIM